MRIPRIALSPQKVIRALAHRQRRPPLDQFIGCTDGQSDTADEKKGEAKLVKLAPVLDNKPRLEKREKKKTLLVDVALADTSVWQQVWGIGPVLAERIVKFRDALGGFHSLDQLKEVYGISEEQFEKMLPLLRLGNQPVQKWPVNSLSVEELVKHPYISYKQARHIVRYREQHGSYTEIADMEAIHALQEEFLRKIAPYLEFGD